MASKPEDMQEHCDECGTLLEMGQIGKCDDCQGAPSTDDDDEELNVKSMTHSALERFAQAVDLVMNADDLDHSERTKLICWWAYQYNRPDMLDELAKAIARCQGDPDALRLNASSTICPVTGEVVAFSPTRCD